MLQKLESTPQSSSSKIMTDRELIAYLGERCKWLRNLAGLIDWLIDNNAQVLRLAAKARWEKSQLYNPVVDQRKQKTHFQIAGPNIVRSVLVMKMGLCFQCTEGTMLLKAHLMLSNVLHFAGSRHSLQAMVRWCLRSEICRRGFIQIKQGLTIFKSHILLSACNRHSCHPNNLLTKELQPLWMQGFLKFTYSIAIAILCSLSSISLFVLQSHFYLSFLCQDP